MSDLAEQIRLEVSTAVDNDELELAEKACQKALQCDSSFSYAYLTLGNIHLDLEH